MAVPPLPTAHDRVPNYAIPSEPDDQGVVAIDGEFPPPQDQASLVPTYHVPAAAGGGGAEVPPTPAEAQWFNALNPPTQPTQHYVPLMADLAERRGWRPPQSNPLRGLAFAFVSVLLIGAAITGTLFFLSPDEPKGSRTTAPAAPPTPTSEATITSAETTPTTPSSTNVTITTTPVDEAAAGKKPNDVPTAAIAKSSPPPTLATKAAAPPHQAPTPAPRAPAAVQQPINRAPPQPATGTPSLPDLDRAAAAQGMTPAKGEDDDTSFSTPSGSRSAPAPTPTPAP